MCLAVPVKVESITNNMASCSIGDSESTIEASIFLLQDDVKIGDYLLVHAGFAIQKLDVNEALETIALFRQAAQQL